MKIENQVVILELAKKLKDAGYPQGNSYWYWCLSGNTRLLHIRETGESKQKRIADYIPITGEDFYYSAPTVAELGEKLPYTLEKTGDEWDGICWRSGKSKKCSETKIRFCCDDGDQYCFADTEADARAKMWLYLKEKGLL